MEFLSKTERDVVNAALKGSPPNIYKDEEFIDVLERFNCRSRVCPLNVYGIILELARQELFQKPYLMISTWQRVLDDLRRHPSFNSIPEVLDYYGSAKVTATKIMKLFRCDRKSDAERECLVQFVRSLSDGDLEKFLRFLTGSE